MLRGASAIAAGKTTTVVLLPTSATTAEEAVEPAAHDRILAISGDRSTVSSTPVG